MSDKFSGASSSLISTILLCIGLIVPPVAPFVSGRTSDGARIFNSAGPAVVLIETIDDQTGDVQKLGSGFVVSPDGKILTNFHVIAHSRRARITLADRRQFEDVKVLAVDEMNDIALLKISVSSLPTLPLGSSGLVAVGQAVFAIGNPLGLQNTITGGIISGIRSANARVLFQLSAPISPGSSGGPVLDLDGHVIGVDVSTLPGGQNLNFAIPIDYAKPLLSASIAKPLLDFYQPDLSQDPKLDLEKLKRYLRLGMETEAEALVTAAIKASEFDPKLRFLYGQILEREKKYVEAIEQFRLAYRLDPSNWRCLHRIAIDASALRVLDASSDNARDDASSLELWTQAYNAWKDLANFKNPGRTAEDGADAAAEVKNAAQMLKVFQTPLGRWKTLNQQRRYFVFTTDPKGTYILYAEGPKGLADAFYLELTKASQDDFVGTYKMRLFMGCYCDLQYTVEPENDFASLLLRGRVLRVYGPNNESCRILRDVVRAQPDSGESYELKRVW